jgi:hypothetical protein
VDAQRVVDDSHSVRAHHAGAGGVVAGAAVLSREVEEFVVILHLGAGETLFADKPLQCGCGEQPTRKAQPADDGAAVGFFRQVARVDRRRVARAVDLAST